MKNPSFRIFLSAILSVWILSSCTIEEEFVFNEDFSGTHSMRIDFQRSTEMGGAQIGPKLIQRLESDTAEMEEQLYKMDSIPGISNAFFKTEANAFSIGYSFESTDLIDMPFQATDGSSLDPASMGFDKELLKKRFELDGDKLYLLSRNSKPQKEKKKSKEEDQGSDPLKLMAGMDSILVRIEMKTIYKFKKPIKRIKKGEFELSKDKKTMTSSFMMDQDPNAGKTTVIKF